MQVVDLVSPLSATVAAVVVLLSIVYYYIQNRNVLPGPSGLPYFGLWPFLDDEKCHLQFQKIGKKYGDLYSFKCCGKRFIHLGSIKAIREAHVTKGDCFAGRTTDFTYLTSAIPNGVGIANGEAWKCLRKFSIQAIKEYAIAAMRDNMAGPIEDAVSTLVDDLKKSKGKTFNVVETLTVKCTGTMKKIMFGEYPISDEKLSEMIEAWGASQDVMTAVGFLLVGNFSRFVFSVSPRYRKARANLEIFKKLLHETVEKMHASFDENHVTCVIQSYFKERNLRKRSNDPTWKYFSDTALVDSLVQFVGDGMLSVAIFICIFLDGIVKHPQEQDKIFAEILECIGLNRDITMEDKNKMPYTNAFMNEAIRTCNFFSLFPSLECTKETTLRGYRIPKGSITFLNFWTAHHDPQTFENPDLFDPSRYITRPGKPRAELPVQFGIGKRSCIGESFTMMESFLFFSNIVKNFRVTEPGASGTRSNMFLLTGKLELSFEPRREN